MKKLLATFLILIPGFLISILTFLALMLLAIPSWGALEFDGADQYIDLGNPADLNVADGDFSIVAWITTAVSSSRQPIFEKFESAGGAPDKGGYILETGLTAGKFNFQIVDDTGNAVVALEETANYHDGEPHSIIAVRNGANVYLYFDGAQIGSDNIVGVADDTNQIASIGRFEQLSDYWSGEIWDVRFFKGGALSASEAATIHYSQGNDKITDNLVGWWRMDELLSGSICSVSVIDISGNNNHGTDANDPVYRAAPTTIINPLMH